MKYSTTSLEGQVHLIAQRFIRAPRLFKDTECFAKENSRQRYNYFVQNGILTGRAL